MPIGTMIVVAIVLIVVAVAAAVLSHFLTVSNPVSYTHLTLPTICSV